MQPLTLCAYKADVEPVFDALDGSGRAEYAVSATDLCCPTWERDMLDGITTLSHVLADRLIAAGFVGMRVQSFAREAGPEDINLVLWQWGAKRPSRIVLIDDEDRLTRKPKGATARLVSGYPDAADHGIP